MTVSHETFCIVVVDGKTLLINLESTSSASQRAANVVEAQPIIDSIAFKA